MVTVAEVGGGRLWRGMVRAVVAVAAVVAPVIVADIGTADASSPVVLVASPSGTGASCSQASPCSFAEAQIRVRALNGAMTSDIDVWLQGGTYHLSAPWRVASRDSGSDGYKVVYEAAPGANPVLSGGEAVTGWQLVPGTSGTWVANVPPGFDTAQLYVNGVSAPIAQGLPADTEFIQTPTGFVTTSSTMDSWPDPSSISVVFLGGNGAWTETACPISSISGNVVTMADPCWSNLHLRGEGSQELAWEDSPQSGFPGLSPTATPSYLENAYELLTPGHWSIDRASHQIYYMASAGQDLAKATVIAPALQTLLDVSGTLSSPVHDITISGLQFSFAGWTQPDTNEGFAQMQADWTLTGPNGATSEGTCQYSTPPGSCPFASWTRTPANVVLSATHNVAIQSDTFSHLGGAGLDVYYGSQGDLIEGNTFTDIAASAIQLGSTDDPLPSDVGAGSNEVDANNTVTDNYIYDVANQYLGGVGIWVGYTSGSVISHNQVDDVPYTAISIGWGGWHTTESDPNSDPNVNADNVISDNLLYNYMLDLGDGGAVYTNGSQATSSADALSIAGNVAYNGLNTDFSLYTDAGSQNVNITDNFVYFQPLDSFDTGGCQTVGSINVTNNYFSEGGPAYPCYPYENEIGNTVGDVENTGDNTTVCEDPPPSQAPSAILESAGIEPSYRSLLDRQVPTLNMVGPTTLALTGGQVLLSGSGFGATPVVRFGTLPATAVTVLSDNYLLATAPPGQGTVDVTVTTAAGTSATSTADQVTFESNPPACMNDQGTGVSTKLFSG